jgi:LysM repeat protein
LRLKRVLPVTACGLAVVAFAACGGGGSGGNGPDSSAIPTATLPAELPPVRILGESIVSTGGRRTYTIRSGDTFSAVAERLGVPLDELLAANPGIDPGGLQDGDVINLPESVAGAPANGATPTPGGATSTPEPEEPPVEEPPVEDTPVEEEPIPTDTPPPPPADTPAPEVTPTAQSLGRTYTVEPGDSMASIAARFGYTVEQLIEANPGVDPNNLQPGQTIILP